WVIAHYTSIDSGNTFDTSKFTVDTSALAANQNIGGFYVRATNLSGAGDLELVYVPEPGALGFLSLGGAMLRRGARRRRRPIAHAEDVSAPATLQMFEATWRTMENRAPDILKAGYGGLWTPPPQRADSGNQSVGYDVYDRFDLGSAGNPTLYGTQTGLQKTI